MAPTSDVAQLTNGDMKPAIKNPANTVLDCPHWVADELGVLHTQVATMEVDMSMSFTYSSLSQFLATVAEKIPTTGAAQSSCKTYLEAAKCNVSASCDDTDSPPKLRLRIGRGFSRVRGHGPVSPTTESGDAEKEGVPKVVFSAAREAGKKKAAAEVKASRVSKAVEKAEEGKLFNQEANLPTQAEVDAELKATAEYKWDGDGDVIVNHFPVPRPMHIHGRLVMFNTFVLYAAKRSTLEKIGNDALIWHHAYNQEKKKATKGSYVLCTLEIDTCGMVDWRRNKTKTGRPLTSIFLKAGQRETIVTDFRNFANPATKSWYLDHGLPYRRAYLFYGPPGVGKTSMIKALAGELGLTIYFLCLSDKGMGNLQLQRALAQLSKNAMIVLEDVDVLFNRDRDGTTQSPLTFSGLLNALDGLVSEDGVLTVLTTNHIDRLDPALIRAGRVDRRFKFDAPDRQQIIELFKSYYPKCDEKMPGKFAELILARREPSAKCIATLQQHFIFCQQDEAETCVSRVDEFFTAYFPNDCSDPKGNIYV